MLVRYVFNIFSGVSMEPREGHRGGVSTIGLVNGMEIPMFYVCQQHPCIVLPRPCPNGGSPRAFPPSLGGSNVFPLGMVFDGSRTKGIHESARGVCSRQEEQGGLRGGGEPTVDILFNSSLHIR